MRCRRLLFAALLAVCFDAAVPLEPSAHGSLIWEDDEEEAILADERRPAAATARTAAPRRDVAVIRARLVRRTRGLRPVRRRRVTRVVHVTAPRPRPSPTEDH